MRTSTIVMIGILGLAATPLALHLAGGSSPTTRNWIKTLHGGGSAGGHGGSTSAALHSTAVIPSGSEVPKVLPTEQDKKPAPKTAVTSLAGTWMVDILSDQGNITATMVLKQDGNNLTGTFTNPHGEGTLPVAGHFADGAITLSIDVVATDHEMHLAFKGAAKEDGSLAGTMTSAMGESKWTAIRKA